MKQQTTAVIEKAEIDGEAVSLSTETDIELEFSAIDTGGGFHDPILDFAYELTIEDSANHPKEGTHRIILYLRDPSDEGNILTIPYRGTLKSLDDHRLEGMGRLSDDDMNRGIVKFLMRSVR